MQLTGGNWVVNNAEVRTTKLPAGVTLTDAVNTAVQFDTRGNAVGITASQNLTLRDNRNRTKRVTVWSSGQVIRENR
jgi:hypothetical protein